MRMQLFAMPGTIAALTFTMTSGVAIQSRILALIFTATIEAPRLQAIQAALPRAKFHRGLFLFAPDARFDHSGTSASALCAVARMAS